MNGYSGHTFKFTKTSGEFKYVQIHFKTDQGVQNLTNDEAAQKSMADPDHATRDLFESIKKGEFPSWTVYVQVLAPEDVEAFRWDIFDLTKVWPQSEVPLREVGKMTLNRNVSPHPTLPRYAHTDFSSSQRTTSPRSNKSPSPPVTWSLASRHLQTQCSRADFSAMRIRKDTAWA
jgi:hypothetical protein